MWLTLVASSLLSLVQIVLVATSASELKNHPTGTWVEEVATPYYLFKDAGYEVVLASPAGGPIPIDQNSLGEGAFTSDAKKFMHDANALGAMSHSVKLDAIDFGDGVDAIYLSGGHGVCVDYINNATLKAAIESLFAFGKVVAADCHGPIGFVDCVKPDGSALVKDKNVTGFSDSEEKAVQLDHLVPFLLETRFKEQGAKFEKTGDWGVHVCVDGNLVTGQNPASSEECAKAVINLLK